MSPKAYQLHEDPKKLHLQEKESSRRRKKPQPFKDNLREFISNTNLHGFRYFLDEQYSWAERIWWMAMVLCSIVICAFSIQKVWVKWEASPVIVSFADTSNYIWDIPFPAITICSGTHARRREFNFTEALLTSRKQYGKSEKEIKMYQDMLMLCDVYDDLASPYANVSSIETFKTLAPTFNETFYSCSWENLKCPQMFYPTLTQDGYCFTFNMLSAEDMFRTENLHKDYFPVAGHTKSNWTLADGYNATVDEIVYPFRQLGYGRIKLQMTLFTDVRDWDPFCDGPVKGFKIWVHNPAELPRMGQNFFRLPIQYESTAAITPRVMDISKGLMDYSPLIRKCYFPEERYLKFFRHYTQNNCALECSANHTAKLCECVPFYMPHGPETKLCGGGKKRCIEKALKESSLRTNTSVPECGCLQDCYELNYEYAVSHGVYDWSFYSIDAGVNVSPETRLPSRLVVYFAEKQFTILRRSELYGSWEFLANCGGIMGLFMGFSFLSLVEIIYYFTMRLWCQIRRSSTVVAAE